MPQRHHSSEAQRFLAAYPAVRSIDLIIADVNGCQRGKRISRAALPNVFRDGICLPGSLYGMDITGKTVEASGLGFDIGDADFICRPISGRLVPSPWRRPLSGQALLAMRQDNGAAFFADPRAVLIAVTERFRHLRLRPVVALELEFYLIDRKRTAAGKPRPPLSPITGEKEASTQVYGMKEIDDYAEFMEGVRQAAEVQGLPADADHAYRTSRCRCPLRHRQQNRSGRTDRGQRLCEAAAGAVALLE